ncbi:ATP-dependent Clp protease ATP-binding subunit [Candidatus Azambacteria bacterium]|nr:ATP-dependent Clp protease ATP-binding subunit [Candidatus Azambacteria bacterium]
MFFNLRSTKKYQAILFPKIFVKSLFWISLLLASVLLAAILLPNTHIFPLTFTSADINGWFFVFLFIASSAFMLSVFYNTYLMDYENEKKLSDVIDGLKNGADINLAEYLDYDAALAIHKATLFTQRKKIQLTYNSVFLFLLENQRSKFIFDRLLINGEQFRKSLEVVVASQKKIASGDALAGELEEILLRAVDIAVKAGKEKITFGSLFSAIVLYDKVLENLFFEYGAKKDDVVNVSIWEENYYKEYFIKKSVIEGLGRVQGIADSWTFGYTPVLLKYAHEMHSSDSPGAHIHALGRDTEINKIEEILSSSGKKNVILVGEPGVGRENIILGFSQRIKRGITYGALRHKRLMMLDMNAVISRTKDASETVALLEKILSECLHAGNIVLIILDIHNYLGKQEKESVASLDISGVLTPYLKSDKFQLIAVTDHSHYHSNVEAVPSVSVLLEKVEVAEFNEQETILKLEDLVPAIESHNRVFVSYHALLAVVADSGSYIQNIPFPEKAISLLSEVVSFVKSRKVYGNIVTQDHVTEVISQKTGIPLGRIEGDEKSKLLNMESLLHERVIGQDQGIKALSEAMRRVRAGISERKKPIGTFLFLGPTGVGKTETAKALANVYFGSEERMIRLDMSEYQDKNSIQRLIGSADTGVEAQFANKIRENPFSLVLLDEFEKSHPDIANLMLQVLDEGRLTDAYQKKISFRNTIIIATSNAGAEFVREYILSGQNPDVLHDILIDHLIKERIFKPEFLNRFDAVVAFSPLTKKDIKEVAKLLLKGLAQRLEEKGMKFQITDELLDKMAEIGYSPAFGAREMKRTIQEKLENRIAEGIIKEQYTRGSEIYIDPKSLT